MSDHGYHHMNLWPDKQEHRDVPCFKCGTEPRLEGHKICSGCHVESSCRTCYPSLHYTAPNDKHRGVLDPSQTRGFVI